MGGQVRLHPSQQLFRNMASTEIGNPFEQKALYRPSGELIGPLTERRAFMLAD